MKWLKFMDQKIFALRSRYGSKGFTLILLLFPAVFGSIHFGWRAFFILLLSVFFCVLINLIPRWIQREKYVLLNPGSVITGLLIGMTVSVTTPFYMVIAGACFAEGFAKLHMKKSGRNLLNPAVAGRTLIAIMEMLAPQNAASRTSGDLVTGASVLFREEGWILSPDMSDAFFGFSSGAIGETSAFILLICLLFMVRYVLIKKEACLSMIFFAPVFVMILPGSADIVGHAPWTENPALYLFGGGTLLCAVFMASDPGTTPQTRLGGVLFGMVCQMIAVAGNKNTAIPGWEMYAILLGNLFCTWFDRIAIKVESFLKKKQGFSEAGAKKNSSLKNFLAVSKEHEIMPRTFFQKRNAPLLTGIQNSPFERYKKLHSDSMGLQNKSEYFRCRLFEVAARASLCGRGGALFPVMHKWRDLGSVHPVLIVNAQEGEPGVFKDRCILAFFPNALVEGIAILKESLAIEDVILVVDPDFELGKEKLRESLQAFVEKTGIHLNIKIVDGSGHYISGEETALLEFLEGHRPEPRTRPPYPVKKGLFGRPTLIHNVETITWIPQIIADLDTFMGQHGLGHTLVSLSGAVNSPGVYEVSLGTSIGEIVAMGDGFLNERTPLGFGIGGPSGYILPASMESLQFDAKSLEKQGGIGTSAICVYGQNTCLFSEVLFHIRFFESASCGLCSACKFGTGRLSDLWEDFCDGLAGDQKMEELMKTAKAMKLGSKCGLGRTAPRSMLSVLEFFPQELARHEKGMSSRECRRCQR